MGGMSMKQLFRGNAEVAGKDYVELFLEQLPDDGSAGEDEDSDQFDCDDDKEDCTTIVGNGLHGPIFDNSYDEFNREYGNQAELNYQFSAAAIIVIVPPASARLSAPSTGGASSTGRPPVEAYSGKTMGDISTFASNTTGGDTAVFDLTSDAEDQDQASLTTVR
ncbi:MAG: hypothetical protein Q9208_008104 [Pyrenodesmia sp. 3 TL-2023]